MTITINFRALRSRGTIEAAMRLYYLPQTQEFEFECTYHENSIPKKAGFFWNPEKRKWMTDKRERAMALMQYGSPAVREMLTYYLLNRDAQQTKKAKSKRKTGRP